MPLPAPFRSQPAGFTAGAAKRRAPLSLFVGVGFIMLAYGLQSSVLGVRAVIEEFSALTTGLLMTGFYAGFFFGSLVTPPLIARVGHIRVFAGLASLASSALLVHPIFLEPVTWASMRLVAGFSYAGLYVVIESWLNEASDNSSRGRLIAVYSVVMQGSIAVGYLLLNVGDPGGFALFTLASILVSLSLVPLTLGYRSTWNSDPPEPMALRQLVRTAPFGVGCAVLIGAAHAIFYSMGAVYGRIVGWTLPEISVFLAAFLLGGMLLQWPIGTLSDRVDRRWVILVCGAVATAFCAMGAWLMTTQIDEYALAIVTMGMGGFSLPIYGMCVAFVNDHLKRSQIVAATSLVILLIGAGAAFGPALAGLIMDVAGAPGFYLSLGVLHAAVAAAAVLNLAVKRGVGRQERFSVPMPLGAGTVPPRQAKPRGR